MHRSDGKITPKEIYILNTPQYTSRTTKIILFSDTNQVVRILSPSAREGGMLTLQFSEIYLNSCRVYRGRGPESN
jgi:hypothetical protein